MVDQKILKLKLCLTLVFLLSMMGISSLSWAQNESMQVIEVQEETLFLKKPDLDADSWMPLVPGQKFKAQKKTVGRIVQFYKAKIKGKIGFVSTADAKPWKKIQAQEKAQAENKFRPPPKAPLFELDGAGPFMAWMPFNQVVKGHRWKQNLFQVGLKLTGDHWLTDIMNFDYQLGVIVNAPQGNIGSEVQGTGFAPYVDAKIFIPRSVSPTSTTYFLLGPSAMYQDFSLRNKLTQIHFNRFDAGLDIGLGYAIRSGDSVIKFEAHYIWKRDPVPMFLMSWQSLVPL